MWSQLITVTCLIVVVIGQEQLLPGGPHGIHRIASKNVRSMGYKMVYGDEDINDLNEVVEDVEKRNEKLRININEELPPLPPRDVKCLMSIDKYCSAEMAATKSILVRAVKDNCLQCSVEEKKKAGRVMVAMMSHNSVAWKYFVTRSALLITKKKRKEPRVKLQDHKYKDVGEAEDVTHLLEHRYIYPGVTVKVKAFRTEVVFDNKTYAFT